MKKLLIALVLVVGAYQWYAQKHRGYTGDAHGQVIMYSLTTCGYCVQKRQELATAGIPFEEFFIDQDRARHDELGQKLRKSGISPQRVGTPTFDVHGYMLINNPSLEKIREHMKRG